MRASNHKFSQPLPARQSPTISAMAQTINAASTGDISSRNHFQNDAM
jgi:hypothetical protein